MDESNDDEGTHMTLGQQLWATRKAVKDLSTAVEHLAERQRRSRSWMIALGFLTALVFLLGAFVWTDSKNGNRDLRELGENLFLFSCQVSNDGRKALREDNIADAEALILVTGADTTDPEAAEQYREITRQNNEAITERDCKAELDTIVDY